MEGQFLRRWKDLGLTSGLNEKEQNELAELFENTANYLLEKEDGVYNEHTATVVFPIIRRLFVVQKHIEELIGNPEELCRKVDIECCEALKLKGEQANIDADALACLNFCLKVFNEAFETRKVEV